MRRYESVIIVLVSFLLVGWNFPNNTGLVVDQADIFNHDQERAITEELSAFQAVSGTEVQVVTVNSLEGKTVEQYGRVLFTAWHGASTMRHFVLLVAPTERKVYADWSDALNGPLNNNVRHRISVDTIRPRWRAGQQVEAIVFGLRDFEYLIAPGFLPPAGALFAPAPIRQAETPQPDNSGLLLIKGIIGLILLVLVGFILFALWYAVKTASAKRNFQREIEGERADVKLREVEFDSLVARAHRELPERLLSEELSKLIREFTDAKKGALELIQHADANGKISIQAGFNTLNRATIMFRSMTGAHTALQQLFTSTVGARDSLAQEIKSAEDEIGRVNNVLVAARGAGHQIPVATHTITSQLAGYREAAVQSLDSALNAALELITEAKDPQLLINDPLLALDKLRAAVALTKTLEVATEGHIEKAGRCVSRLRTVEGDLTSAHLQYKGRERELIEAKRRAPEGTLADSDDNLSLAKDQLERADAKVAEAKDQASAQRQVYTEALEILKSASGHIDGAKLKIGLVMSQIKKHVDAAKNHTLDRMSAVGCIATTETKIKELNNLSLLEDLKRACTALEKGDAFIAQSPPNYLAAVHQYQDASAIANDLKGQAQRAITEATARSLRSSTSYGSNVGSGGGYTGRSSGSRGGGGKSSAPRSPSSSSRFSGGSHSPHRHDTPASTDSPFDAGGSSSGWDDGGDTGGGGNDGGNGGGDDL